MFFSRKIEEYCGTEQQVMKALNKVLLSEVTLSIFCLFCLTFVLSNPCQHLVSVWPQSTKVVSCQCSCFNITGGISSVLRSLFFSFFPRVFYPVTVTVPYWYRQFLIIGRPIVCRPIINRLITGDSLFIYC